MAKRQKIFLGKSDKKQNNYKLKKQTESVEIHLDNNKLKEKGCVLLPLLFIRIKKDFSLQSILQKLTI
jgi:hypothetical protein